MSNASLFNLQEKLQEITDQRDAALARQELMANWIRLACSYLGEKLTSENQAAIDELRQRANKLA